MKKSKIGAARENIKRLQETLRGVLDAVEKQPLKTDALRKETAYAEVVLKETGANAD